MDKFLNWLVFSSENPNNVALTIKGILLMAVPVVVNMLQQFGIQFAEQRAVDIISSAVIVISSLLTLIGLVRKLINTFSDKEVVVFTKDKKKK